MLTKKKAENAMSDKISFLNIPGLIFLIIIMIPYFIYASKCPEGFLGKWKNKVVEILEQVGRFGCFICMAVNIPGTVYGFENSRLFWLCVIFGTILVAAYCIIWYFWFWKNTLFRALSLSILPSVLFIFCGIMSRSILLIVFSAIFSPCHILISVKNCTQN